MEKGRQNGFKAFAELEARDTGRSVPLERWTRKELEKSETKEGRKGRRKNTELQVDVNECGRKGSRHGSSPE